MLLQPGAHHRRGHLPHGRSLDGHRPAPARCVLQVEAKRAVESKPVHRPPRHDLGHAVVAVEDGQVRGPFIVDAGRAQNVVADGHARGRSRAVGQDRVDSVHFLAAQTGERRRPCHDDEAPAGAREGRVGADGGAEPGRRQVRADDEDLQEELDDAEADHEHRELPAVRAPQRCPIAHRLSRGTATSANGASSSRRCSMPSGRTCEGSETLGAGRMDARAMTSR